MGRTFEALKQSANRKPGVQPTRKPTAPPASPKAASPAARPDYRVALAETPKPAPVPNSPEIEMTGIPFIEIGGRGTPLEASPDVLASPVTAYALQRAQSPTAPLVPRAQPEPTVVPAPEPTAAQFRPLAMIEPALSPEIALELVAWHDPKHTVSQQYRELLAGLRATLTNEPPQVLLFTGLRPGIGASIAVLNLAITAAKLGSLQVAVVEAYSRSPSLAKYLQLPIGPGLIDWSTKQATLEQALQPTSIERLWALPIGRSTETSGPVCLPGSALLQLRQHFDFILVDGPIWQNELDLSALAAAADAVFVLAPQAEADLPDTERCVQEVRQKTQNLRGLLLT